jgi:hypothetical protein
MLSVARLSVLRMKRYIDDCHIRWWDLSLLRACYGIGYTRDLGHLFYVVHPDQVRAPCNRDR